MSVDGFIADNNGRSGWMLWNWGEVWGWDKALQQYHIDLSASADCVVLSRKMAEEGFIRHWKSVAEANNDQARFAASITAAHKVVFTNTLKQSVWENTVLAKGDLTYEINNLKAQTGRNIIAYGGASFASALVQANLVDEFHLVINPALVGQGLTVFNTIPTIHMLSLIDSKAYPCGVVVTTYAAKR